MKTVAIVLAAGRGKRMGSDVPKQYLQIEGKPILYYSMKVFEDSFIDEIVLVTSKDEIDYCRHEIVEKYDFKKVTAIVEGGKERYHSVANGLDSIKDIDVPDTDSSPNDINVLGHSSYVFIHDGARPFVDQEMLERLYSCVKKTDACVAGMPVKDTIKIADHNGYIKQTPNRDLVWSIQTPQVFEYSIIQEAYQLLLEKEQQLLTAGINITDDAMVVETLMEKKVKLVEGSYRNIKITTPEDLDISEMLLKKI